DRQRYRLPNRREVGEVTLKERRIGQHADGGGAVSGINIGDGHRIKVSPQDPGRRRCFFDLGDDGNLWGFLQASPKLTNRRRLTQATFQLGFGDCTPAAFDLLPFTGDNLVQNSAHVPLGLPRRAGLTYKYLGFHSIPEAERPLPWISRICLSP